MVAATVDDPTVTALRAAVLGVANTSGLRAGLSAGALPLLAGEIYAVLTSPPMLGPPGTTGPPAAAVSAAGTTAGTTAARQAGTGATAGQAGASAAGGDKADGEAAAATAHGAAAATDATATATATARPAVRAWFGRASAAARTSVLVADRWAGGAELSLLATVAERMLPPGVTVVWDLAAGDAPAPRCAAGAALWVVALDAAHRPVPALIPPRGEPAPARATAGVTLSLPAGTTRVAVTALADGEPGAAGPGTGDRTAGWRDGSALRQIAGQVLLGAGAVVRPQSPAGLPRRRSRRSPRVYRELGVTTGRDMVERNWTRDVGGRVRRGWIETWLPSWCETVDVGLTPEDGDDRAAPPAPLVMVRPETASAFRSLDGAPATAGSGGASWRFPVPDGQADGADVIVRATAPDGWRLAGVTGSASRAAQDGR